MGFALGAGGVILIVLAFSGVFGGGDQGDGGFGEGSCDEPLPPLGESPLTAEEFAAVDAGLGEVVAAARAGSFQGAEAAFFGRVHNLTHNVDPPLREKNSLLAKVICEAVLGIEQEFVVERRTEVIASEADRIRQLMQRAKSELGLGTPR